ncbi:hypothetical protein KVT40_001550 [Elsinoe batatas]|uniref:Uncharacterized protein n=1 Tax=Elsinoe batatas TaxID=2601811 RepID=A0A8K0L8W8_9PEZI|nr:hypothetical protein KVT40_001550 [Elsinoe batatas]
MPAASSQISCHSVKHMPLPLLDQSFPLLQRRRPCSLSKPSAPVQPRDSPSTLCIQMTQIGLSLSLPIPSISQTTLPSIIPTGTFSTCLNPRVGIDMLPANPLAARPPSFIYPLHHHTAPTRPPTLSIASGIEIGKSRHINSRMHAALLFRHACIPPSPRSHVSPSVLSLVVVRKALVSSWFLSLVGYTIYCPPSCRASARLVDRLA